MILDRVKLNRILGLMNKVVSNRHRLECLQGIQIKAEKGQATFIGTNLDVVLYSSLQSDKVNHATTILVNLKALREAMKGRREKEVLLSWDDDKLIVNSDGFSTEIPVMKDEFVRVPATPALDDCLFYQYTDFIDTVNMVSPASVKDDARPVLESVCLQNKRALATDGYKLIIHQNEIEIPATIGEIKVGWTARGLLKSIKTGKSPVLWLTSGNLFNNNQLFNFYHIMDDDITYEILEGVEDIAYPDVDPILNYEAPYSIEINKTLAIKALGSLSKDYVVALYLDGTNVRIVTEKSDIQTGTSLVAISTNFMGEHKLAFNPTYLMAILENVTGNAKLSFLDKANIAEVRDTANPNYLAVIMPMHH